MYAVVEILGQQFIVEKGEQILAPKLENEVGSEVSFDKVLLTSDDNNNILIGTPVVEGVQVKATIMDYERAKKILVYKKKRRKDYQKKNGHRQHLTRLKIQDIVLGGSGNGS
jgi:large subunit ribosomal protein L21